MPSGFQQDNNQLSPGFYRVIITMNGGQASWTQYGNDELSQQGRINPYTWDAYDQEGDLVPSSDDNGIALANGNLRWQAIIDELGKVGDCQILDIEVTSNDASDANTDIDMIAFTVKYDRDESVFPSYNAIQKAEYNSGFFYNTSTNINPNGTTTIDGVTYDTYITPSDDGTAISTTELAIQDLVWRGVMRGWFYGNTPDFTYKKSARVYKESTGEGTQEYVYINAPGNSSTSDYWNDIAVNPVDGTTTTLVKQNSI